MAITSKRENILEHIRTKALLQIDGTDNFNLAVSLISRDFLLPDQVKGFDLPCCFILDDFATSYSQITGSEYTTGNTPDAIDDGMIITIIGYCSVDREIGTDQRKTGSLSTQMNRFFSDIVIAMNSDRTLGGNCLAVTLLSSVNSLEFIETDVGIVLQTYAIKYDFNPTATTPVT